MQRVNITETPLWELRIRNVMNTLSESEGRVAEYILGAPDAMLGISVQRLAQASGVSEATVVRFFRRAGFSGLKDFKNVMTQERTREGSAPLDSRRLHDSDTTRSIKKKVFWGCIDALVDTVSTLDDGELARAIDVLSAAPYIEVFGIGGSASVARSALHSFRKIGLRMNITTDINFTYLRMERFHEDDVVLAISRSGETKEILDAVRIAKQKGVFVISITNAQQSSLSKLSDCCLTSTSRTDMLTGDDTYEHVAQIAIIHALYAGVAMRLNEAKEP